NPATSFTRNSPPRALRAFQTSPVGLRLRQLRKSYPGKMPTLASADAAAILLKSTFGTTTGVRDELSCTSVRFSHSLTTVGVAGAVRPFEGASARMVGTRRE